MPPKRKATLAPGGSSPPLKRRLRSTSGNGPSVDTPIEDPPTTRTRRKPRANTKPAKVSKAEPSIPPSKESSPPPKRGRPTRVSAMKGRSIPKAVVEEPPRPSSSKETLDNPSDPRNVPDPESSEDELLISPAKENPISRLVTPPRRHTTPRKEGKFMEAVEIRTPSWLNRPSLPHSSAVNSPGPSSPRKRLVRSPPRSVVAKPHSTLRARAPAPPPQPIISRDPSPHASPRRSTRKVVRDDLVISKPSSDNDEEPSPVLKTPPISPSKKGKERALVGPKKGESSQDALPESLHPCLRAQKTAILKALHKTPPLIEQEDDEDETSANALAYEQLTELLKGTVLRGEGNSCILTGPPGSGKTQMVERVVSNLPEKPIIVRLSGHAQTDDRLAMREIAWQLAQQTGTSLMPMDDDSENETPEGQDDEGKTGDEDNPFLEGHSTSGPMISLPPPAHLLALISVIPTLSRPTIIILDAFDLFAMHARQSLLYCLFDTAQHSRGGANGKGMAIVGVTTRIDTINLLEKRVKSRFSGRILRTAGPGKLEHWLHIARSLLCVLIESEPTEEWSPIWHRAVDKFLKDEDVKHIFAETFALTRDCRVLSRILTPVVIELDTTAPFPSLPCLTNAVRTQRCPEPLSFLPSLPYPAICLLIAA
ncbi:hypothetical protein QCA50_000472 [Cerrena zonata]|uniref:Origin recognition complex subunit 4 n=1 Tax=Cerrena zonata TaxID=2478898 RepID=A0AAW0GUX8_9APHY